MSFISVFCYPDYISGVVLVLFTRGSIHTVPTTHNETRKSRKRYISNALEAAAKRQKGL